MPVVIRELVIRATVSEKQENDPGPFSPDRDLISREDLVRECVTQVLEILEQKNER